MPAAAPTQLGLGPGARVIAADIAAADRERVTVEVDGAACELRVAPARPGEAAYAHVGHLAISHGPAAGITTPP